MPSLRHQALVELFRQSPQLATRLLEELNVPVPFGATHRTDDSDLSTVKPVHRHAEISEAKPVVEAALIACHGLPPDDRLVYSDMILEALGPALKEALMTMPKGYKFQTEFIRNIAARYANVEALAEAKGEARGEARGMATVLSRLLVKKFGPLSSDEQRRLQQASPDELEAWTERILTADSLDAVFGS